MVTKPYIKSGTMGIKSYSTVGWIFNTDTYCNSCAKKMGITNDKSREEMAENDGYPISADSEWDHKPHCENCKEEIPYVTVLDYE